MAKPTSSKNESVRDVPDINEFIPGFKDMNEFIAVAFRSVMAAIKSSNDLPSSGDDFDYYSSFDNFRTLMDIEGSRVLQLIQKMMRYHGARGNITSNQESRDTEDRYDVLVDANDQILERVGTFLDEAAGLRKKEAPLLVATATVKPSKPISGSWNKKTPPSKGSGSRSNFRLLSAKNIQRPQLKFRDKIDNTSRPFVPKLQEKPNALKPLSESLEIPASLDTSLDDTEAGHQFPHPYQYELEQWRPLPWQLERGDITEAVMCEDLPSVITTTSELHSLMADLVGQREIAIDLEHHSYRSFQGITCLMQVSTRTQDYIIDTLSLRAELHVLNAVFTDRNVVKVLHGADMDIEWLQRDLGLYVVNMFDTGQAARVLNLQRFSLAYLLSQYCGVEANKQYQLADWRIRPLPEELLRYAREDTHYLLYIYDRLRGELIDRGNTQKNLLESVIQRSTRLCAKTYKKPRFGPDNYLEMYHRTKKVFNSQQLLAFQGLYNWRDSIARAEDESLGYILPNHMLMQICEVLPREYQGILACCNPIPPLVRQNLMDMHRLVKEARDAPLVKVAPLTPKVIKPSQAEHPKYDVTRLLHCPHDMSHVGKQTALDSDITVPVAKTSSLFKSSPDVHICNIAVKPSPLLAALGRTHQRHEKLTEAKRKAARIKATFVNPVNKFLPMDILQRVAGDTTQVVAGTIEEKWTLLPHTEKPQVVVQTEGPVPEKTLESSDIINVELEDPETSLSVRQQFKKKPKKRESDGNSDLQTKKPRNTDDPDTEVKVTEGSKDTEKSKSKKVNYLVPDEDFEAYDYTSTDYNVFDKPGGKGSKSYDPHGHGPRDKRKGGGTKHHGKGYSGSGKKSLTYTKGGQSGASKIPWPKR